MILLAAVSVCAQAFGPSGSGSVRVGSWNVYYKALDDPLGQAAIIKTIDTADQEHPFDFFGVVEAQGDSPAGNFSSWIQSSTALQRMTHVSGQSGYEIIALFYDAAHWKLNYSVVGEFESGRPYLIAQFLSATGTPIWVTAVHLNHYFLSYPNKIDPVIPGKVLAEALQNASDATGADIATASTVMFGDWNEFEWADFEPPYKADAVARMAPLWDGYFNGRMKDAVPPRTLSCCTKWAASDRFSTNYSEWRFEYDHVFYSDDLLPVPTPNLPTFLPYTYPGCAAACADAACTGEEPPLNTTATSQGSWHRAVHATLGRVPTVP